MEQTVIEFITAGGGFGGILSGVMGLVSSFMGMGKQKEAQPAQIQQAVAQQEQAKAAVAPAATADTVKQVETKENPLLQALNKGERSSGLKISRTAGISGTGGIGLGV